MLSVYVNPTDRLRYTHLAAYGIAAAAAAAAAASRDAGMLLSVFFVSLFPESNVHAEDPPIL
jgi:hypothetical protein